MRNLLLSTAPLFLLASQALGQAVEIDENLPDYEPTRGVSGAIKSEGSDTMNNLMSLWAEGFRKHYPGVQIEIQGKGSSTAPPALISGTSTFGPMSRKMKAAELDAFKEEHGYEPVGLPTSIDMLAVYVHKDNPIAQRGLTLQQVDAIFSKHRKGGFDKDITTWGDLGLDGEWAEKPISLYGRNSASGTYGYFKKVALFKGDYKASVKEMPGSSSVVSSIATDKYAMGYSGIGYKTAGVAVVPLAEAPGEDFVSAAAENAYDNTYPLARFLLVYVNYRPGSTLEALRAEFIKYVFSEDGQTDVVKDGYFPIPAPISYRALASVGIEVENPGTVKAAFSKAKQ